MEVFPVAGSRSIRFGAGVQVGVNPFLKNSETLSLMLKVLETFNVGLGYSENWCIFIDFGQSRSLSRGLRTIGPARAARHSAPRASFGMEILWTALGI